MPNNESWAGFLFLGVCSCFPRRSPISSPPYSPLVHEMFGLNSPSPRTTNPPLATVCGQLETSVKSFAKAAVQWNVDERVTYGRNRAAVLADEDIQSSLFHIRTIQENSLWVNYPRRLRTDVIVSFKGCIDSLDRQTTSFWDCRNVPQTQHTADENARKFTKTLQHLKRDAKHNFEILSA